MKTTIFLAMLASLIVLAGCGPSPSLYPIYTDATIVFEPGLIGTWRGDDDVYQFEQYEDTNRYRITATDDDGAISQCIGTLCRIGENLWLDLERNYDEEFELSNPSGILVGVTTIPVHGICRVNSIEPNLSISNLSVMGLITYVAKNPDSISYEWYGENLDSVVLTGSTEELQKFLLEIEDIPDAFDLDTLTRVDVDD